MFGHMETAIFRHFGASWKWLKNWATAAAHRPSRLAKQSFSVGFSVTFFILFDVMKSNPNLVSKNKCFNPMRYKIGIDHYGATFHFPDLQFFASFLRICVCIALPIIEDVMKWTPSLDGNAWDDPGYLETKPEETKISVVQPHLLHPQATHCCSKACRACHGLGSVEIHSQNARSSKLQLQDMIWIDA